MKTDVCLTFDYEMFFGISGTVGKCMIEPTARILDLLHEARTAAVFFVDSSFLLFLKRNKNFSGTFDEIERQIRRMIDDGHRVEFHLHPHWIDALPGNVPSTFLFPDYSHYKIGDLSDAQLVDHFYDALDVLISIVRKSDMSYALCAFRAGGFCIEPFSRIRDLLISADIRIDSSVACGVKLKSSGHVVDFSSCTNDTVYRFEESPLRPANEGRFIEIPITTRTIAVSEKIINKLDKTINKYPVYGDGSGMPLSIGLADKFSPGKLMVSFDNSQHCAGYIRKAKKEFIGIISHPKSISERSLHEMEILFASDCSFITTKDVYDRMSSKWQ